MTREGRPRRTGAASTTPLKWLQLLRPWFRSRTANGTSCITLCLIALTKRQSSPRRLLCWRLSTAPSRTIKSSGHSWQTVWQCALGWPTYSQLAGTTNPMLACGDRSPKQSRNRPLRLWPKTNAHRGRRHAISSNDIEDFNGNEQADTRANLTATEVALSKRGSGQGQVLQDVCEARR